MHMADALLSPAVGLAMDAVSLAAIGLAVAKVKKNELIESKAPIMGVAGAMVFAAQMINFTIPGTGSSGHIGGGILLAGLLGGTPAFLSLTAVLIIQCLFFADGGLLALGCNIFNMGVIPCLVVYPLVFKPLIAGGINNRRISTAAVVSSAAGLMLGAFCVVFQTSLSGITLLPFGAFTALMLPIHLVIGLVEGIVTAGVLCFIHKMRPEIISSAQTGERTGGAPLRAVSIVVFALALICGGLLTFFSSSNPDGLEWAIERTAKKTAGEVTQLEDAGYLHSAAARAQENTAIFPDYGYAGDPEGKTGTSVAGVAGAVITFALAGSAGLVISKIKKSKRAAANG